MVSPGKTLGREVSTAYIPSIVVRPSLTVAEVAAPVLPGTSLPLMTYKGPLGKAHEGSARDQTVAKIKCTLLLLGHLIDLNIQALAIKHGMRPGRACLIA